MSIVEKMLKSPLTGKRTGRVFVRGRGWYMWNSVFHVYNSYNDYTHLRKEQVIDIDWSRTSMVDSYAGVI